MMAKEKVMITEITHAIEQTISPAWNQPKKVIKAIEKSAQKLAHKLSRTIKKEGKSLLKVKRNAHKQRS
ncbi:hypothetical protein [Fibrella aquatilis]|uniref:Uncharacterized protein n=1 Tax=Fibrella aquatilis TaxID=2817059 RepID=A0A939G4J7_9BACT|nr:hypothetical protein [Fibrella aquatilis]MBO0930300.1 hypothetical protein [Fibrella aquatilis]